MRGSEEIFELRDKVDWRDDDLLDEDDRKNLESLKAIYGFGPFFVRKIIPIEPEAAGNSRHDQFLELVDIEGKILVPLVELRRLSGFWFKKISSARPN